MKPMRGLGFKIEAGRSDRTCAQSGNGGWSSVQDDDPFEAPDVQGVVERFAPDARKVDDQEIVAASAYLASRTLQRRPLCVTSQEYVHCFGCPSSHLIW
jgi:hypothetical protein